MHWLIVAALANAVCVLPLGLIAWTSRHFVGRPVLTHAVWIVVLLKLLTPPIWQVSFLIPIEEHSAAVIESLVPNSVTRTNHVSLLPLVTTAINPAQPSLPLVADGGGMNSQWSARQFAQQFLIPWLLLLWAAGILLTLFRHWRCNLRFGLYLQHAGTDAIEIQERTQELARRLGLRSIPRVHLLKVAATPMLWGFGPWARIIFPEGLWHQLEPSHRDTLLIHELGHFRRGDQWVRIIEMLTTTLYWWHPLVWKAVREIESVEEECCDAWVVRSAGCSPKDYATAIIDALDFVAEGRTIRPSLASGVSSTPLIMERRLTQIMQKSVDNSMSRPVKAMLVLIILLAIPWRPGFGFVTKQRRLPPSATANFGSRTGRGQRISFNGQPRIGNSSRPISVAEGTSAGSGMSSQTASAVSPNGLHKLLAIAGQRVFLENDFNQVPVDLSAEHLTCAAFTLDSMRFVAGTADGQVNVFDSITGKIIAHLGKLNGDVAGITISPDDRVVCSASKAGTLVFWDLASGALLGTWTAPDENPIVTARFSPDGLSLAVGVGNWRSPVSACLTVLDFLTLEPKTSVPLTFAPAAIEFTADGGLMWLADWTGAVTLLNPTEGDSAPAGQVTRQAVCSTNFSPNSRLLSNDFPDGVDAMSR